MIERCHSCGAELYAGAQFCRRCGAAIVRAAEGGDAPTQLFPTGTPTGLPSGPTGAQTGPASAHTSPLGGQTTDQVGQPRATGYQQPFQAFQQTSPLAPPTPARKGRRAGWVFALLAVAVLSAVASVGVMLALKSRQTAQPRVVVKRVGGDADADVDLPRAPVPPGLPERIREAVVSAGVPLPLDEAGAQVSGSETVITKTYQLGGDKSFSLKNLHGDISIEGWDSDEAQVKVIKRGGSEAERRGVPVLAADSDESLMLVSLGGDGKQVSVAYEVKLPRGVRQVEVSSEESNVKVAGLEGTVVVDVRRGALEFRGVSGSVRSKLTKGHTKVVYETAEQRGAQEYTAVRGNVEVDFADGASADLKAETMDGDISVDDALGLKVVKQPAGQHVVGRLGDGDDPILIKVVNGDIKLKQ